MNDFPEPLVQAEVDLRDFAFMPLDVVRLRDSDLAARSSAEEFRCAVLLWCASWHQMPAASLPDDDAVLASLAGFGRSIKEWLKQKRGALRGWVKCSDGRLYHPVVAEKANEAWQSKQRRRDRTAAARAAKLSQGSNNHQHEGPTERVTQSATISVTETVTGSKGQGQGQGYSKSSEAEASAPNGAPASIPIDDVRATLFRVGTSNLQAITGKPEAKCKQLIGHWLKATGDDASEVFRAINAAVSERVADPVSWITAATKPKPSDWRQRPELQGVL